MILSTLFLILTSVPLDKVAHAGVSYGITHATNSVCNVVTNNKSKVTCLVVGITTAATLGALKEASDIHDKRNTREQSSKDMLANFVGIGAASLFITINF